MRRRHKPLAKMLTPQTDRHPWEDSINALSVKPPKRVP
jgi:hypothetical protein